jgi:hypothetical protein
VRIDGKKPSEFPELYAATQTVMRPRTYSPSIMRVQREKPWVLEDWTLTVTEMSPDRSLLKFKVKGSVTGEDGEGDTGHRFVSKSGRVVIDVDDYAFAYAFHWMHNKGSTSVEVRWSIVPLFADEFALPDKKNPFGDTVVTVAQGLTNGKHTLEVTGSPETPIQAVRVYRPPLGRQ